MLADIVKIHCLTHRANFPMSRTSRVVVCKEGAEEHILSSDFPSSGLWIHCCNCQTFFAWEMDRTDVSVKECPFCLSSLNPRLYACDHCAVTMLDFDDPTLRKHHTVLSWGMPQPACPGCHQFPRATPKTHYCEALQCNLSTARATCPFCQINLAEPVVDGAKVITAKLDAALASAEARAREAEERRKFAEEAARKEVELRVQAERKAEEIEKKVTRDLSGTPIHIPNTEQINRETESLRARAEAEARAREAEELRRQAEMAARREAEMRAIAEQRARELSELQTSQLDRPSFRSQVKTRGEKISIALYAAFAGALFLLLLALIATMIRIYYM